MSKDDTVRRVDVEWLGLGHGGRTGGRITDYAKRKREEEDKHTRTTGAHSKSDSLTMTNAETANKASELLLVENITDHTVALALEETTLGSRGHNTGGVLYEPFIEYSRFFFFRNKVFFSCSKLIYLATVLQQTQGLEEIRAGHALCVCQNDSRDTTHVG